MCAGDWRHPSRVISRVVRPLPYHADTPAVIAELLSGARVTSGRLTPYAPPGPHPLELSVVLPALDRAGTLAACITQARRALDASGIAGEIIVVDQGSTDGSPRLAESLGARVVMATSPGYGSAVMAGVAASVGQHILVGDADGSYDFGQLPRFVGKLREGYDFVQGCRLPRGGGTVARGAMPSFERWCGVPVSSWMVRRRFAVPVNDAHCGMRAFSRALYLQLGQRCTGDEFGLESVVRAGMLGARITEVPITLNREVAGAGPRVAAGTVRDGLRHLRVHLMRRPR